MAEKEHKMDFDALVSDIRQAEHLAALSISASRCGTGPSAATTEKQVSAD